MLQAGGEYQRTVMQGTVTNGVVTGIEATADGTTMTPVAMENGAFNTLTAQISGITTATVTWEATTDGTNYKGFLMAPTTTEVKALTSTADGIYRGTVSGFVAVRARISAWTAGPVIVTGILTKE
jgi:hypothetical protein